MATLLLIRHGQTKLHQDDRFWGKTDIEMSDTGIRQARQLRDRLASRKISAIYASTLGRAIETAQIIASPHKAKVTPAADLCECNFGYIEGLTYKEIIQKFPDWPPALPAGTWSTFPAGKAWNSSPGASGAFWTLSKS
jgi:broad specificity phosphatase PhoE